MTFKKIIPFLLLICSCNKLFAPETKYIGPSFSIKRVVDKEIPESRTVYSEVISPSPVTDTPRPTDRYKPTPPPSTIIRRGSLTYSPATHLNPTNQTIERARTVPTLFPLSIPRTYSTSTDDLLRKNRAVLELDPSTLTVGASELKPLPSSKTPIGQSYTTKIYSYPMTGSQPAEKPSEPAKSVPPIKPYFSNTTKKTVDAQTGTEAFNFEPSTELPATGNKISFNTGSPLASSHKKAQFIKLPKKGFGLSFNEDIDRQFSGLQDHVRDRLVPGLKYGKDYNIVLAENDEIAVLKLHIKGASKNGEKQKGVSLIMINANGQIYYYSAKTKKWISESEPQGQSIVQALKKIVAQRMPSKSRHRSNYSSVHKSRKSNTYMMVGKKLSRPGKSAYSENSDKNSDNDSDTETTDLDDTSSNNTGSSSLNSSRSSNLDL